MAHDRFPAINCMARRDGLFLVTYKDKASKVLKTALSGDHIDPGARFIIRKGAAEGGADLAVRVAT